MAGQGDPITAAQAFAALSEVAAGPDVSLGFTELDEPRGEAGNPAPGGGTPLSGARTFPHGCSQEYPGHFRNAVYGPAPVSGARS
jgi:hypothetical protein